MVAALDIAVVESDIAVAAIGIADVVVVILFVLAVIDIGVVVVAILFLFVVVIYIVVVVQILFVAVAAVDSNHFLPVVAAAAVVVGVDSIVRLNRCHHHHDTRSLLSSV